MKHNKPIMDEKKDVTREIMLNNLNQHLDSNLEANDRRFILALLEKVTAARRTMQLSEGLRKLPQEISKVELDCYLFILIGYKNITQHKEFWRSYNDIYKFLYNQVLKNKTKQFPKYMRNKDKQEFVGKKGIFTNLIKAKLLIKERRNNRQRRTWNDVISVNLINPEKTWQGVKELLAVTIGGDNVGGHILILKEWLGYSHEELKVFFGDTLELEDELKGLRKLPIKELRHKANLIINQNMAFLFDSSMTMGFNRN